MGQKIFILLFLGAAVWGVTWLLRKHRQLEAEAEEMDREVRENLQHHKQPAELTERQMDSMLELRAGKKIKPDHPAPAAHHEPPRHKKEFL